MADVLQAVAYIVLFWLVYSGVLFLIVLFEQQGASASPTSQRRTRRTPRVPFVSILIPAYNEEKTIAATIEAALAQRYPRNRREIIVIDDGSTDQTATIAARYTRVYPTEVFLISKPNGGKHTALNEGLKRARGTYIVTLDADSQPEPDALAHLVQAMEAHPNAGAATPLMVVRSPETLMQHMQSAEYLISAALRRAYALLEAQYVTPGPFSIFRRSALRKVGPYRSAHNTEDLEMALRLQKHGWRILNIPQARVMTATPRTFPALLRQRVRWSYGFLRNVLDYRDLIAPRYRHLGLFVLPNLLIGFAGVTYAFGFFLWKTAHMVWEYGVWLTYAGLPSIGLSHLDWFFFPTQAAVAISACTLLIAILLLQEGKRLARVQLSPLAYVSYLTLYSFLAPLWILRTLWQAVVVRTPTSWRAERAAR